jgi:hypothetical protein
MEAAKSQNIELSLLMMSDAEFVKKTVLSGIDVIVCHVTPESPHALAIGQTLLNSIQ